MILQDFILKIKYFNKLFLWGGLKSHAGQKFKIQRWKGNLL